MGDWEKQVMRCISYQSFSYQNFLSNSICTHHNHYHHHPRDIDTVYTLGPRRNGEFGKTTVKEIEI